MKKEEMERVVGGESAKDGEFPYAVALYNDGEFVCTGEIISNRAILTAAHCVVDQDSEILPARVFMAVAGVANRSSSEGVRIEFRDVNIHPGYDGETNDLAILETSAPIEFNKRIQPICIANEKIGALWFQRVVAVGWGQTNRDTDNPELPEVVQYAYQRIQANLKCQLLFFGNQVPSSVVCASGLLRGICSGDSGGPLVYNHQTRPVLVGTASYVNGYIGCGHLLGPAAYSRISSFTQYIKENAPGEICVA